MHRFYADGLGEIGSLVTLSEEDARGYSLTAFHREHPEIRDLAIVIGPEGGMSADEIARMKDCGCQSVTLGPRILRTETAGLCALSALFCLYGELE